MTFTRVRLYGITCPPQGGRSYEELVEALCQGGVDAIQFREKTMLAGELVRIGRRLAAIARRYQVLFVVNDRPDVALAIDADGVHLGQEDLPIDLARRIIGAGKLIGRSTHSLAQALQAEREGADYIAVGPIFATPTKPDYSPIGVEALRDVMSQVRVPVVAIGGIDLTNIDQVIAVGAERVAVVRAVCTADDPVAATKSLKDQVLRARFSNRLLTPLSPPQSG